MSTNKTITPVVAIPATQRKDDVIARAVAAGFTITELERYEKQQEYRKQYNQRENVKQHRAEYNRKRYDRSKQLRELLKGL